MKKTDKNKIKLDIYLRNYSELSILDLLTLETLENQKNPIKRYPLYLEVNNFLINREEKLYLEETDLNEELVDMIKKDMDDIKSISTSSFYNSLINLEKKGLVKFNHKNKKIKTVEKTQITSSLIKILLNNLLQSYFYSIHKVPEDSAEFFKENYDLSEINSGLIILLDEFQGIELEYLSKTITKVTLLTQKPQYRNYLKDLDNLTFTSIENEVIREPENFFEIVYLGRIQKNTEFNGLVPDKLVKETIRVLKPGGKLIIATFLSVKPIDNLYIDILLNIFNELNMNSIFEEEELRHLLESNGIDKIDFIDYKGFLITIGSKSQN